MNEKIEQLEKTIEQALKDLAELKKSQEAQPMFKPNDWVKVIDGGETYPSHPQMNGVEGFQHGYTPENGEFGRFVKYYPLDVCSAAVQISINGKVIAIDAKGIKLATPEEIEAYLRADAEKRGFVVDAMVKRWRREVRIEKIEFIWDSYEISATIHEYYEKHGHGFLVIKYDNNSCAVPLEECTIIPDAPTIEIGGVKVKFYEGIIYVYDKRIAGTAIIKLRDALLELKKRKGVPNNINITSIAVTQCNGQEITVPYETIKQIAEHFEKKKS